MVLFVGRRESFDIIHEIEAQGFQNAGLHEVADTRFGHRPDACGVHDMPDLTDGRHARQTGFLANVGGHALERHDGCCPGLFGDQRLLGIGDVHDDAALEHLREPHLYAKRVVQIHTLSFSVQTMAGAGSRFRKPRRRSTSFEKISPRILTPFSISVGSSPAKLNRNDSGSGRPTAKYLPGRYETPSRWARASSSPASSGSGSRTHRFMPPSGRVNRVPSGRWRSHAASTASSRRAP